MSVAWLSLLGSGLLRGVRCGSVRHALDHLLDIGRDAQQEVELVIDGYAVFGIVRSRFLLNANGQFGKCRVRRSGGQATDGQGKLGEDVAGSANMVWADGVRGGLDDRREQRNRIGGENVVEHHEAVHV